MKTCRTCGAEKPTSEYHKNAGSRDGLASICKACKRESARQYYKTKGGDARREYARNRYHADKEGAKAKRLDWVARNPNGHRRSYYRRHYGITPEQRDAQAVAQGGKCLLCDTRFDSIPDRHVHVDHCHETGTTRGLLCHWCNTQMGTLEKSPGWIARALAYLARGGDWKAETLMDAA